MINAVSYYRVSTGKQEKSGLGLEAQREAVQHFAKTNEINILHEYTEVESGVKNKRPVLQQALTYCRKNKATLIIAKLDRLGRSVAFISALMESEVSFVALDNPEANEFISHIQAAFAQQERKAISIRTKDALQAAKKRGVKLGSNAKVLAKKNKEKSIEFARKMKPQIEQLKEAGHETIRGLVIELNRLKIETASGKGKWHVHTVYRLLKQINKLK